MEETEVMKTRRNLRKLMTEGLECQGIVQTPVQGCRR